MRSQLWKMRRDYKNGPVDKSVLCEITLILFRYVIDFLWCSVEVLPLGEKNLL